MVKDYVITLGNPLLKGVTKELDGYNFTFVSLLDKITLKLYRSTNSEPEIVILLDEKYRFGDVFAVKVSNIDLKSYEYAYYDNDIRLVDHYAKQLCDTYEFGNAIENASYRSKVELDNFNWEDDRQLSTEFNDTVIYKLHVRGFTKHSSSKVKHKGTFLGVIEKIPYLKELGITAVELMPVFEFEEVCKWTIMDKESLYNPTFNGKVNYWGYTKGLYYSPKAAYCSKSSYNKSYPNEFKELVKQLHKAGIEIIIEMYFGNDATIDTIWNCVRYWVMEYHIDGIHINCDKAAIMCLIGDPLLSKIKIISDYWDINIGHRGYKNLASYSYGFMNTARKLLKGDEDQIGDFVNKLKSNSKEMATVNFVANSNGFTLMDMVSYDRKHNEANGENNHDGESYNNSWNCGVEGKTRKKKISELRNKQIKNALLMLLLSQGTPLIMAGDEFGNSQNGNNNPYCQDNEISWLNWNNLETNKWIFEFVKSLIEFRKKHGILHMEEPLRDMDYKSYGYPDVSFHGDNAWFPSFENYSRHIGVMYCCRYADNTKDGFIYVAYNMHWEEHKLALPNLKEGLNWKIVISTDECSINSQERCVMVNPRSIVVLEANCEK